MRGVARVTCLLLLVVSLPPTSALAQEEEPEAVVIMEEVERLRADTVWPGYDPAEVPVAIYDGARTWLFGHPSPPDGFEAAAHHGDVWVMEGRHEAVTANTTTRIGGVPAAALLLSLLEDFPSPRDRAGVVVHEAFHTYQRSAHPEWQAGGMGLENPATDAGLLALRRLETEELRRAVEAEDDERAAAHAAAALEVRDERFRELPSSVVAFERGLELLEGTAQHVQVQATGSRNGLMPLPEGGFGPEALFMRSYAAGFALTRLLERLDPDWEEDVEAGRVASLDGALARAVDGAEPADRAAVRAEALARAQQDVRRLVSARDSLRTAFLERDGWRIEVLAAGDAPLGLQGMDPANLTVLGGAALLHDRWVRLGDGAGQVEVMGRAALTEGFGSEPLGQGIRRLVVTGVEAPPAVEIGDDTVTVQADGFEAAFRGAAVEREGRRITVRLGGA